MPCCLPAPGPLLHIAAGCAPYSSHTAVPFACLRLTSACARYLSTHTEELHGFSVQKHEHGPRPQQLMSATCTASEQQYHKAPMGDVLQGACLLSKLNWAAVPCEGGCVALNGWKASKSLNLHEAMLKSRDAQIGWRAVLKACRTGAPPSHVIFQKHISPSCKAETEQHCMPAVSHLLSCAILILHTLGEA